MQPLFVSSFLCGLDPRAGKCDLLSPWPGPYSEEVSSFMGVLEAGVCLCSSEGLCWKEIQQQRVPDSCIGPQEYFTPGGNAHCRAGEPCSVSEATAVPRLVCPALQLLLRDSSGESPELMSSPDGFFCSGQLTRWRCVTDHTQSCYA